MMVLRPAGIFLLIALLASPLPARAGESPVAENATGTEILARIYAHVSASEALFPGHFSRRRIVRRDYDPDDGELRTTHLVEADVWGWLGESDRMKVLSCQRDGKEIELSDCEPKLQGDPLYPMFGAEGREYYRLEFVGEVQRGGMASYQIRAVPKQETSRHFKGDLFFRKDTLSLRSIDGGLADHPFGLQKLHIRLDFEDKNGRGLLASGESDATLYVPLLIDSRIVTEFEASQQRHLAPDEKPAG
jgi:hypothetical protein